MSDAQTLQERLRATIAAEIDMRWRTMQAQSASATPHRRQGFRSYDPLTSQSLADQRNDAAMEIMSAVRSALIDTTQMLARRLGDSAISDELLAAEIDSIQFLLDTGAVAPKSDKT